MEAADHHDPEITDPVRKDINMTTARTLNLAALAGVLAMSSLPTQSHAQVNHFNELANLPFAEGRPTKETAQTLRDELLFQRATQTYLWAMPLINTLGMQVGSEKTFWRRLQRPAHLEEATRRQNSGHDPELRRSLRAELRRPGQGWPIGDGSAD